MTDHPFTTIALALEALAAGESAEMVLEADMESSLYDAATTLRVAAENDPTQALITEREHDEYPPCPICGDPIDYCLGHGATTEENA